MNIKVTKHNKIIFKENNIFDDRYEEILILLKDYKYKENYNLFVQEGLQLECINLLDIFD